MPITWHQQADSVYAAGAPAYDVCAFGAVGDGVTDDSAAIQAALGAASGGGVVFFPARSTFTVTAPLTVGTDVELQGAGASSVLRLADGANATMLLPHSGRVTLRRLTLDGNAANQASGGSLVSVQAGCTGLLVEDCRLTNAHASPIVANRIAAGGRVEVRRCRFDALTDVVAAIFSCVPAVVEDCTFSLACVSGAPYALSMAYLAAQGQYGGSAFRRNVVDGSGTNAGGVAIYPQVVDAVVAGNVFRNFGLAAGGPPRGAILLYATSATDMTGVSIGCQSIKILDNLIDPKPVLPDGTIGGPAVPGNSIVVGAAAYASTVSFRGLEIVGNAIIGCYSGIAVGPLIGTGSAGTVPNAQPWTGVVVRDNLLRGLLSAVSPAGTGVGCDIQANDVRIDGNLFEDCQESAIFAAGTNILVRGNQVVRCGGGPVAAPTLDSGINLMGWGIRCEGNRVVDSTNAGIHVRGDAPAALNAFLKIVPDDIVIVDNTCVNTGTQTTRSQQLRGIHVTAGDPSQAATRLVVRDNRLYGHTLAAVDVTAASTPVVGANLVDGLLETGTPSTVVEEDHFVGGTTVSGGIGRLGWGLTVGTLAMPAPVAGHPGVRTLATPAGVNSYAVLYGPGTLLPQVEVSGTWEVQAIFRANQVDGATDYRVGLALLTDPPSSGAYLERLAADTHWFFVTRAGGVQSRFDTTLTQDTGWLWMRIRRYLDPTNAGANTLACSVNGGAWLKSTTNTFAGNYGLLYAIGNGAGGGVKSLDIDYYRHAYAGLTV